MQLEFPDVDNHRLARLCGPLDAHLAQLGQALDVRIVRRGASFVLEGDSAACAAAARVMTDLYERPDSVPLEAADVQLALVGQRPAAAAADGLPPAVPDSPSDGVIPPVLRTRRSDLAARTVNQRQYLAHILGHDLTFGVGPAGTGKTFLAVACAVDALERNTVQRLILTRPAVEAGERLGFLPGDLAQKVDPYLRPLYDALYDLMGMDRVHKAFERQQIEIAPLAFMRGRTLNNAFVILDEAQNTTSEQMKMFLTRTGFGSRVVITGDTSQVDLPRGTHSGLVEALGLLDGVQGVAITRFDASDVVRHPLVARIVKAYERASRPGAPARSDRPA
ncbi:PhoH family protein [Amphibiibacter pelophylacis]|uniref:PhoH family protein n=1 Tax=Amphibiibacter pelophylacis TaxID=1799477 RepID=A0ACC6P2B8_9BURK